MVLQADVIGDFRREVLRSDPLTHLQHYNRIFEPPATPPPVSTTAEIGGSPAGASGLHLSVSTVAFDKDCSQLSISRGGRRQRLSMSPGIADTQASSQALDQKKLPIPGSYCFSPNLVPPPADWPSHVKALGFCRDPGAGAGRAYQPTPELEAFLNAGDPPLYIGFGSMIPRDSEVRL